jgi:hypothetical protein
MIYNWLWRWFDERGVLHYSMDYREAEKQLHLGAHVEACRLPEKENNIVL